VEPEPEQDDADPQATALTAFPSDLSSHHCAEHKAKLEKVNEFAGHHNVEIYVEKRDPKLKPFGPFFVYVSHPLLSR
jgi:hypothetical protein